jgi:DNA topoisomerase IA
MKNFRQLYYGNGRYSRPPARYTEASLVKKLEELGLVVRQLMRLHFTIINRNYVEKILTVRRENIRN